MEDFGKISTNSSPANPGQVSRVQHPFRESKMTLNGEMNPTIVVNDSSRKRPMYIISYIVKIMFLLLIICGILSLVYPFFKTAFKQSEIRENIELDDSDLIRDNIRWHQFVAHNLSDVIEVGGRWEGKFVQPTGPVPFVISVLHTSYNINTHSTLFTALFYNDYFNLTISGDYMSAEQGYLVMYFSNVNSNSEPSSNPADVRQFSLALTAWRADAYISIFNHSQIQFRGHMQPSSLFGPFSMHSENEKLEVAYNDNNYQIKGSTDTDPKNDIGGYELYPLEGMGHMGPTRIEFRRGQREIVGVLIGISIPVLLVLFALLAIITNHFRKLCCSSDSSIAFQKFQNFPESGQISASSSAYDTRSYITQSTSTGGALSRSCTFQDPLEAETDLDENIEVQVHPNKIQITQNESIRVIEMHDLKPCSSTNQKPDDVIELHTLPRMNTSDRLKVLFSDDVREIPRTPVNQNHNNNHQN